MPFEQFHDVIELARSLRRSLYSLTVFGELRLAMALASR